MINKWELSGEIVRIREHRMYDLGATIIVRGSSARPEYGTTQIVELPVFVSPKSWKELTEKKVKLFDKVYVEGQMETSITETSGGNIRQKINFYAHTIRLI